LEYYKRNNCASVFIDYIHPLHEKISAAISSSKKFGDTLSESSLPEEKRPHRETSRSGAFRGDGNGSRL